MRKLFIIVAMFTLFLSLDGCGLNNTNTTDNSAVQVAKGFGKTNFKEIGNGLYYDVVTEIVYMVNGSDTAYESRIYCPYYAPNGLPYKYNPETFSFEEISGCCEHCPH